MVRSETPYNPLDKLHLAESVATSLLSRPIEPLPPSESFNGAGLYAIYYAGRFPLYEAISKANSGGKFSQPIYVGKAVPKGARKGGFDLASAAGTVLYNRLREHSESVGQAKNLKVEEFKCRYLVTEDTWIPLGESLIIERFQPLWNVCVDGFGIHDPGSGRYQQKRSTWDILHPGRTWAEKCVPGTKTVSQTEAQVQSFLVDSKAE